ncbi:pseudouridine synthase [Chytriomyces cf. hyalinus JEL632]|nr:pseudouridine synthase [Chytriomyces cf. hyalinus JEL632]
MAASSDSEQFRVHYSDPETCSVNEVLHFLAATHDSVFKPKLSADVLILICAFLPPLCGFCQRIHDLWKFDCSRCHGEVVFCRNTPCLEVYKITEANSSGLTSNSSGFKCMRGCEGRICPRCVEDLDYGPFLCHNCSYSFVYCCRWRRICDECFEVFARLDDMPDSSDDEEGNDEDVHDDELLAAFLQNSGNSDLSQSGAKESLDVEEVGSENGNASPAPVQGEDARYKRKFSIPILYYNPDTFVVVDKPFDVRIDGDASQSPTLQSLLDAAFPQHAPLRLVHQLDHWRSCLGHQFQQRKTRKAYSAIVAGFVLASDFFINSPIADMLFDERKRMCVGSSESNPGREAETHATVVKRGYMKFAGSDRIKKVSLLELKPESGRRHQLEIRKLADLPSNIPKIWMRYGLDGTPVTDEDLQINERATTDVDSSSVK